MPRKKSAAKKAKEAALKAELGTSTGTIEEKKVGPCNNELSDEADEDNFTDNDSSEEEDDYGELVTEEVEDGINKVLNAIRSNDTSKLLDPKVRFFEDPEHAVAKMKPVEKHRPIYLKDYHRENILSGGALAEDDENMEPVEGSYRSEQKAQKQEIMNEINKAFDSQNTGDESDDGLVAKKNEKEDKTIIALPDPKENEDLFLDQFVNQQAWIPKVGDKVVPLDLPDDEQEDDEEFDDAVENFEKAYNFRYEDPNAAEIISYARNQATLRRAANNSRRKKREEQRLESEKRKKAKEAELHKKKTKKVNQISDILEQLTKEYGAEINERMVQKITDTLLNNDFKHEEWDRVVSELFNEEFYGQEGKPTWDDDDEIMKELYKDDTVEASISGEVHSDLEQNNDETSQDQKKTKKNKKSEKSKKKKEKKSLAEMVEKSVEQRKLALLDELEREEEERRGRSRDKDEVELKFRYREVSPESYGLSVREIFAADDADLNEYVGLKKFAPYRPKELRAKDKRKVTKSKRLREWRKKVFNNENGLDDSGEIALPVEDSNKKRIKHKHHRDDKHAKRNKKH